MKSIAISGSARQNVGKRDAKELRYEGKIPAVLYGGKEQTHFSVSAADLKPVLYTPEVIFVELEIGGKKSKAIVQEAQFHPLTDEVTPQEIEVPMEGLEVGKSYRVGQVALTDAKVLNNADDTIVSVTMSRALRQAEQEAAKAAKGGKK